MVGRCSRLGAEHQTANPMAVVGRGRNEVRADLALSRMGGSGMTDCCESPDRFERVSALMRWRGAPASIGSQKSDGRHLGAGPVTELIDLFSEAEERHAILSESNRNRIVRAATQELHHKALAETDDELELLNRLRDGVSAQIDVLAQLLGAIDDRLAAACESNVATDTGEPRFDANSVAGCHSRKNPSRIPTPIEGKASWKRSSTSLSGRGCCS